MSQWFRHKRWNSFRGSQLQAVQGTSWTYSWVFEDASGQSVDLTAGYTAQLILKKRPSASTPVQTISSSAGKLVLDGLGGVTLTLTPTDTAAWSPGKVVFELRVTAPGGSVTLLDSGTLETVL